METTNLIDLPRVEPDLRPELEGVMLGLMDSTNSTPSRKRKRTEPSILVPQQDLPFFLFSG